MTTYQITHDRISPEADTVTEQQLRDYLAEMNETGDWGLNLDSLRVDDTEASIELDGEQTVIARAIDSGIVTVTTTDVTGGIAVNVADRFWLLAGEDGIDVHEVDPDNTVDDITLGARIDTGLTVDAAIERVAACVVLSAQAIDEIREGLADGGVVVTANADDGTLIVRWTQTVQRGLRARVEAVADRNEGGFAVFVDQEFWAGGDTLGQALEAAAAPQSVVAACREHLDSTGR